MLGTNRCNEEGLEYIGIDNKKTARNMSPEKKLKKCEISPIMMNPNLSLAAYSFHHVLQKLPQHKTLHYAFFRGPQFLCPP